MLGYAAGLDMPAQAVSAASCWVPDPYSWLARTTQLDRGWSVEEPATHVVVVIYGGWSEERRCRLGYTVGLAGRRLTFNNGDIL